MFYWELKILNIPNLYQLRELLSIQEEEEEAWKEKEKDTSWLQRQQQWHSAYHCSRVIIIDWKSSLEKPTKIYYIMHQQRGRHRI